MDNFILCTKFNLNADASLSFTQTDSHKDFIQTKITFTLSSRAQDCIEKTY